MTSRRMLVGVILALAAAGCGGGGGGGSPPAPPPSPPVSTGPTWQQGVFQSASTFINKCATVRTGKDSEGNTFPDQPGSLLQEMFFLRSWTNTTYLWNTEVADQNPASFTDRIAYFNVLKTNASTPSGKPKDQFHFNIATADYLAQTNSAPEAGYGAEIRVFAATPPRDVRVVYTSSGTPATDLLAGTPKLTRGTTLLTVDGADVVNGNTQAQVDTLNNGTFPLTAGETHTFTVRYPDNTQRSITLVSAALVEQPVNRTAILTTSSGKVGYMLLNTFNTFSSEKSIFDAITALKAQGISDLVVDLRYNGGGLLAVASQLSYEVAGASRTAGHVFERLQFNAAAGTSDPVNGGANAPTPFYNTGLGFSVTSGAAIPSLDLPRVYVLSTSSTCSASESVINGLRGANVNVSLIGSGTCGKPYGFYPQDNCGQTYFSIQFKGVNDVSFGDYADGFVPQNSTSAFGVKVPGCAVNDDLSHDLGDPSEAMLSAALGFRANQSCPTPPPSSVSVASVSGAGPAMKTTGRSDAEVILRNMRDLRLPNRGGGVR